MSGKSPSSPEFRRYAVAQVRATGRTIREVANEIGVSYSSLRAWLKEEQTDLDEQGDRLTIRERVDLRGMIHEMHAEEDRNSAAAGRESLPE
jgi:transposase-like protein